MIWGKVSSKWYRVIQSAGWCFHYEVLICQAYAKRFEKKVFFYGDGQKNNIDGQIHNRHL